MAKRSPDPETVSKETFLSVYKLPGILGERVFKVFDKKKSGVIDFEEFLLGLQKFVRGSVEDKAKMIFDMCDLNDSGFVDSCELSTILHSLIPQQKAGPIGVNKELNASEHHRQIIRDEVECAFRECDLNKDGRLSLDQFKLWLNQNPNYFKIMECAFRERSLIGDLNDDPERTHRRSRTPDISYWRNSPALSSLGDSLSDWGGHETPKRGSHFGSSAKTWSCFDLLSPRTSNPSECALKLEQPSKYNMASKGICHCCKIVYIFEEERDYENVSLWTDQDYSVFSIVNLAGIKTQIHLKACIQCRAYLTQDSDQQVGNSSFPTASSKSYKDLQILDVSRSTPIAQGASGSSASCIIKQGPLYKKGRTVKIWKARWYILKDKFLYHYKISKYGYPIGDPISAQFIQGCTATIDEVESEKNKDKFCFTIMSPGDSKKRMYSKSYKDREFWVKALQQAGEREEVDEDYVIKDIIGKGKYSSVYTCTEKRTNKEWAAKVIDKNTLLSEDISLLRTEISIIRIVNHPYIISLYDMYESKTHVHLILPLAKGGDLFDVLKARNFEMSEQNAKTIVFKIFAALRYLHDFGIVHRDLKTENILVRDQDNPLDIMLSDFNLSKFTGPWETMMKKVGTIAYVAPEVIMEKGYSYKVDLWSLGCIMHLLLRGYLPFDAADEKEIQYLICNAVVTTNHRRWKLISSQAKDLLKSLLQKNPVDRIDFENVENHEWFSDLDLLKQQRQRTAKLKKTVSSKEIITSGPSVTDIRPNEDRGIYNKTFSEIINPGSDDKCRDRTMLKS